MSRVFHSFEQLWCPLRGLIGICIIFCIIFYTYSDNHRKLTQALEKSQSSNLLYFSTNEFICYLKIAGISFGGSIPKSSLRKSEVISNENLFGPIQNDSVVIVVQVIPISL